jgi:F-type H+-transporting ATPase subunit b
MDLDLTFIFQFFIFLIVLVGLNGILFKPFQDLIEEREKRIKGANEDAERLTHLAAEDREAYEVRLGDARLAAQRECERLRVDGRDRGRELVSDARAEMSTAMSATRASLKEAEVKAAETLSNDIETLAHQVVEKVLGRQVA